MLRKLFNLLAAAALVLSVLAIALWVRSYWAQDQLSIARDHQLVIISSSGRFFVGVTRLWTYAGSNALAVANRPPAAPAPPLKSHAYSQRWTAGLSHSRVFFRVPTLNGGKPRGLERWFGTTIYGISVLGGTHLREEWGDLYYFPHWLVVAALSPFALASVISLAARRRRRRRQRERLCPTCGYDLRASPERCPECGTITPRTAA